jgi:hypothetical protein
MQTSFRSILIAMREQLSVATVDQRSGIAREILSSPLWRIVRSLARDCIETLCVEGKVDPEDLLNSLWVPPSKYDEPTTFADNPTSLERILDAAAQDETLTNGQIIRWFTNSFFRHLELQKYRQQHPEAYPDDWAMPKTPPPEEAAFRFRETEVSRCVAQVVGTLVRHARDNGWDSCILAWCGEEAIKRTTPECPIHEGRWGERFRKRLLDQTVVHSESAAKQIERVINQVIQQSTRLFEIELDPMSRREKLEIAVGIFNSLANLAQHPTGT